MSQQKYFDIQNPTTFIADSVTPSNEALKAGAGTFNISYDYHNGLNIPVNVGMRNGLMVEIPPRLDRLLTDFVIKVKITLGNNVNINTAHLLCNNSLETKLLNEAINNGIQNNRAYNKQYVLDYHIGLHDLESQGGSLYIHNLDTLISIVAKGLAPAHPYSDYAVSKRNIIDAAEVNTVDIFSYTLKIVDPNKKYGSRFTNIHKKVFKIPISEDTSLKEGVYLISDGPAIGDTQLNKPVSIRYDFAAADSDLLLFRSYDDALHCGDEAKAAEQEFLKQKIALKQLELDLKGKDQEHQFEILDYKDKLAKQLHQRDMLNAELEMNKKTFDYKLETAKLEAKVRYDKLKAGYEEQQMKNKQGVDNLNWVKGMLVAGVAIGAILLKLYADKQITK